jgi:hypothetical protein
MHKIMKIALVLAGAFLFTAVPAHAQFTLVSGTVQDPNGIPYAGGTLSALLVPGSSGGYTLNGAAYSGRIGPVSLDATGSFTQNFGSNAIILPASSQWQITVQSNPGGISPPLGTGDQSFTVTVTISGATQSLTSTLTAAATKLTNFLSAGTVLTVTGTAPIASSGGTSPAISCATCTTSAAPLTLNQLILGAGGQAEAVLGTLGTTTTVYHGNAAGAGTFGAVNLATDVTGQVPIGAVGSAGLSGTAPIAIASTGAISLTGQVPIGQLGSAGLSGTSPIVVASTGAISCPTCSTSGGTGTVTQIDRVTQNAAIGSTTLVACPASPAGGTNFLVSSNAKITTAATSTSTLGPLSITYTAPDGTAFTALPVSYRIAPVGLAINTAGDTNNITTTFDSGFPFLVNCQAGSTVTYAFGYASSGGTAMVYDLHVRAMQQ